MLHRSHTRIITAALLLIWLCAPLVSTEANAQTQGFIPNDPNYSDAWAKLLDLPLAWQEIRRIEQTSGPVGPDAVVIVLDGWIDATHPDLTGHVLSQYTVDYTGEATYQQTNFTHGSAVASIIAAGVNNNIGVTSVAGITNRVQVVSAKIIFSDKTTTPGLMRQGFQYALDLKARGVNVVAINCSFGGGVGDTNATQTRQLLAALKQQGIYVFAAAGNQAPALNLDTNPTGTPAQYGADPGSNVIAVAGLDSAGASLEPTSNWGPQTVALAAPSASVPVVSFLNPTQGAAAFSDTSAATPHAAVTYALIRVYKEPDPVKAALRLKLGAVMTSGLQGKVTYGKVNVYNSLTMPDPPPTVALLTESNSTRAIALSSPVLVTGPFPLRVNGYSFGTDTQTRVMLFAVNLDLQTGETASAVIAQAWDSQLRMYPLIVESVEKVPDFPWLTQVVVKLSDSLPVPGDLGVSVTLHGVTSNQAIISVK